MTIWYIKIICTINKSTKIWTKNIHEQTSQTFSTSPQQIRTVKLAMTIIIVFVICWTPYMAITLIEIYSNGRFRIPSWFDGVLQTICLTQSSLNPFIYITFNHRRKDLPTLILASARTNSQNYRPRKQRKGSSSSGSLTGTSFKTTRYFSSILN